MGYADTLLENEVDRDTEKKFLERISSEGKPQFTAKVEKVIYFDSYIVAFKYTFSVVIFHCYFYFISYS